MVVIVVMCQLVYHDREQGRAILNFCGALARTSVIAIEKVVSEL